MCVVMFRIGWIPAKEGTANPIEAMIAASPVKPALPVPASCQFVLRRVK